ncbi:MAG: type II toxin-antitoxin system death-on-curing family toxin [Cytophagales bacterium]|nr:type II toxin-antitoxin system death-on-curing family toxin [Cytophagales bacterium]
MKINHLMIEVIGGNFVPPHNLLNEQRLDYLVEAVQSEMFGQPLYPEIHHKAGLYMFNIIANHIFSDGNKRTGLEAALLFLRLNGYGFSPTVTDQNLIDFATAVASGEHTLESTQAWFEANIAPRS